MLPILIIPRMLHEAQFGAFPPEVKQTQNETSKNSTTHYYYHYSITNCYYYYYYCRVRYFRLLFSFWFLHIPRANKQKYTVIFYPFFRNVGERHRTTGEIFILKIRNVIKQKKTIVSHPKHLGQGVLLLQ